MRDESGNIWVKSVREKGSVPKTDMNVIIFEEAEFVPFLAATRIKNLVRTNESAVLGLSVENTPLAVYRQLVGFFEQSELSFSKVKTFNLDEYVAMEVDDPNSSRAFMRKEFFDKIDIDPRNTYLPTCYKKVNPHQIGRVYENAIKEVGGIDLQILGIGCSGQFGFNEPISSLDSRNRLKTLDLSVLSDKRNDFNNKADTPALAMTMGIGTILEAKQVVLMAMGEEKAEAVCNAIEGPVSAKCPASALQLHPRVTFLLDRPAAAKLANTDC